MLGTSKNKSSLGFGLISTPRSLEAGGAQRTSTPWCFSSPATRKQDSSDLLGSEGPVASPQEWWHLPQSVLCPMTPFCELLVPSIALAWSFSSPPPASLLNHPLHTHPFVNTAHPPCSPHP
uniref:Uncharacterized protein n=1 Tax=Calidris pygmaea TaxID=425635 RepID=A0A8C3KJ97_9CHAR